MRALSWGLGAAGGLAAAAALVAGAVLPTGGLGAPFAAGVADGRAGNQVLALSDSVEAAAAYRSGLATAAPRWARARLHHNLGIALLAAQPAAADSAFAEAAALQDQPAARARYARHAGLAALAAHTPARAVAHLRRALVLDPTDRVAQRAYEIARRRQEARDQPTPEAERIKAAAERLVAARRYADALALIETNRARVPSLAAYDDWTGRLAGVVEIERRRVPADTTDGPDDVPPP